MITLQFDNAFNERGVKPVTYMEGHYLYLCCPAVETSSVGLQEWHPFTISSAPDESVLEVNVRVMPSPYSWTNKVARYLQLLDPNRTGEVELATRNATTGVTTLGKVIGPDGKPFFRVDAPHGIVSRVMVSRVIVSRRTARHAPSQPRHHNPCLATTAPLTGAA